MLAALFVAVIVALVTGLTTLAFKKPYIYAQMERPLHIALVVIFAGVSIYGMTLSAAHAALVQFIPYDQLPAARAVIDQMSLPLPWFLLGWIVPAAYLTFLMWLARKVAEGDLAQPGADKD